MQRSIIYRLVAAMVVVAGLALAGPAVAAQSQSDLDRLRGMQGPEFEVEFMSMMIQHHQSAIDMAKLALDRAMHQEVKDLAQQIIADQTKEISDMTSWLQQWHNTTPREEAMHEDMSMMMKLENLRGDDFDKEFLMQMRMHHMAAVQMAQLVPERATRQELKDLAQNIIRTQTSEIQQIEDWLKAWYNLDVAAMGGQPGEATGQPVAPPAPPMSGGTPGEHMPPGAAPIGMPRTGLPLGAALPLLLALSATSGMLLASGLWLRKRR